MSDPQNDDRIPGLESLGDGPEPPPALETRTLSALRARGLLPRRRPGGFAIGAAALAAAATLFLAGYATGRAFLHGTTPGERARTWMLLLREPAGFGADLATPRPDGSTTLVREYASWARERSHGAVIGGERLGGTGRILKESNGRVVSIPLEGSSPDVGTTGESPRGGRIGGYFLIRAADLEEADRIARTCPHLTHGGLIELREVAP